MEKILNTILEKLESIDKTLTTIKEEQACIREDVSIIKGEQIEFRVETRVNFSSLNDKIEMMNEEVNALVDSYGEITHRVKILNNRYTKDKSRNKDLL